MAGRLSWLQTPVAVIAGVFCLAAASAVLSVYTHNPVALAPVGVVAVAAAIYIALAIDPAITLTLGVVLSPFAGNWQQLGLPGTASPDRLLIAATVVVVLLRAATGRGAPLPRVRPVHYVLALAVVYAVGSALVAHTLFQRTALLEIFESYGVLPFAVFYLAPVIFITPRHRNLLLAALVMLGAYLGLTVVFEIIGPHALVWPRYILSSTYGIHEGRGRGPFADAVANGFGLYACALASLVAMTMWRGRARLAAAAVGLLCIAGTLLTLERSVWIGVSVGSVVVLVVSPRLRRFALPVVLGAGLAAILAIAFVPGLQTKVSDRANAQGSIWDRQNLTTAAVNMIDARPLTGFGWAKFQQDSGPYFQQNANYPLTATQADIANYFLAYAVALGLPGAIIWTTGLLIGVLGALFSRGPPELDPWRSAFLGLAVCFLIVANFVPPTLFQNLLLWLWAGVLWSQSYYDDFPVESGSDGYTIGRGVDLLPRPSGARTSDGTF